MRPLPLSRTSFFQYVFVFFFFFFIKHRICTLSYRPLISVFKLYSLGHCIHILANHIQQQTVGQLLCITFISNLFAWSKERIWLRFLRYNNQEITICNQSGKISLSGESKSSPEWGILMYLSCITLDTFGSLLWLRFTRTNAESSKTSVFLQTGVANH